MAVSHFLLPADMIDNVLFMGDLRWSAVSSGDDGCQISSDNRMKTVKKTPCRSRAESISKQVRISDKTVKSFVEVDKLPVPDEAFDRKRFWLDGNIISHF